MNTREELGLPDPNTPLIRAARENDALADSRGLEGACREIGIDFAILNHIAEQRALRARLVETGRIDEIRNPPSAWSLDGSTRERLASGDPWYPNLSDEDHKAIAVLTMIYMDAITIGWRAHEFELEQTEKEGA